MKRHGHLFEQVVAFDNLVAAARRAVRGKTHRPAVGAFLVDLEPEVLKLERELRGGTYEPQPYRIFWVHEPKPRRICAAHIPTLNLTTHGQGIEGALAAAQELAEAWVAEKQAGLTEEEFRQSQVPPGSARHSLEGLGLSARPPPIAPARPHPQPEFD